MNDERYQELLAGNAYRIFVSELEKHLEKAQRELAGNSVPAPKAIDEAKIYFHTIKGGAGFFGLTQIANQAAEIENLCKQPIEELISQIHSVRDMIREIEKLSKDMPEPAAEEKK